MSQLLDICSECDGLSYSKGYCKFHYKKQYYKNPDNLNRKKESDSRWRKTNIQHKRKMNKIWAETNPDKVKTSSKKWYDNNKELHSKRVKICRTKNREQYRLKENEWRKNNPEKCLESNKRSLQKIGDIFNLNSMQYKWALMLWSKTVKQRDNNKCQNCFSTENLQAHHILHKRYFPQLSLNESNGITLCVPCHHKTHGFLVGDLS